MIAALAAACLLLPTYAPAAPLASAPLPPADLPPHSPLAPPEPLDPLPSASALTPAPMQVSPVMMERPNGSKLDAWLDLPHAFIERRVFDVVNGFDRFFADDRDLYRLRSSTFLRWRNELRIGHDGALDYGTTLRAELDLPYLQKRLKEMQIVLENVGRSVGDPEPRALTGAEAANRPDALLRLTLLETLRSAIDLGGGVLLDWPPGLVGRARFRYARELGPVALARLATTGFWNTVDGFGFKSSVALERQLATRLLLRWTTGTLLTQSSTLGYQSASEVALLATLGRGTAFTVLASAAAESKPEPVLRVYRAATRLRWTFLRRWIYGEVEPEMRWTLVANGRREPIPAVFLRIEIQFEDEPTPFRHLPPVPAAEATPEPPTARGPGEPDQPPVAGGRPRGLASTETNVDEGIE